MTFRPLIKTIPLSLLASAFAVSTVLGAEYVSVVKDGVNLRSGPNTNTDILYQLPSGYPLEILSKEGQWLKVSDYEGDKGYITESLVSKTPYVIVKVKECNIRSGPSANDSVVGKGVKDVIFKKVEQKGDWIKISHPDLTGWVQKDLVWP
ncbi:SH3 type 3 domain protein [Desulfobulbus propionicus DSM 2032]|jgi:SH3-like domain-containing protein|uniref:SH3 type 3 domain protein n=1 Tax=Desulfobulbus propionicus (strain ATCC 33891 / DSM 2032 / VKM B-1956 / 1pr3) TaxID=577650 RepID=A0A7U4DPN2_DESPD|nr:SH3 domain-containing protein [Desulfobulbus propionicus]ADW18326.1 SH3 type 3 domain protein [Desulfobulbus propionicus DSM 2032]